MLYRPQKPPYPHQIEALDRLRGREAFALLMAMRTGKTKVALDDWGRLVEEGKVNNLLVIAPKGVYRTWVTAIEEHLSHDLLPHIRIHIWKSGAGNRMRNAFMQEHDHPKILLMNIEAISSTQDARILCGIFLRQAPCMLVIDESTTIKNHRAKRTKRVLEMAHLASYRRILSGLPTPRSPLDIFCQFHFLSPNIFPQKNFYTFRNRYAIMQKMNFGGRRGVDIVVAYRDVEDIHRRIDPHSFRIPFRPDIPSTYTIREVPLTKEQERMYKEFLANATVQLESGDYVTATIVIVQILRLHQILCGHTKDETNRIHLIPENRTKQLLEILEDYNGKAVIWCSYDHDVRKVSEAIVMEYTEEGKELNVDIVARFWGGNESTRELEERQFKTNPNCRFMVATPSAGGMGRTWDCADLVIYYSSLNNLEHREQSEQRVQGIGKKRQVDYIDLIVPNTVETKILDALRRKINMASVINGDNFREWLI